MLSSPEVLAARNTYQKKWYKENREKVLIARRARYAKDTDWQARNLARHEATKLANTRRKLEYRALVDDLKSHPCSDCHQPFPPECMDFDHVRGEKLFNIGQMGQRQKHLILAEIAKCDLVCANCHRIRTRKRLRSPT